MSDRLAALRLFVRVARRGSFSAGGRDLAVPQPTVSRAIATLEREVGAALFIRSTRAVRLTRAGADFLARVEPILAALEDAEQAVRGAGELRGTLRIAMSSSFGTREVVPRLPAFVDRHPALRLELLIHDLRQDLVSEAVDVALRFGALADSTATARRIGTWQRVVVASPGYLARAGTPRVPADLAGHAILLGPDRLGGRWSFHKHGRTDAVQVTARITSTAAEVSTAAAVAGLGIIASGLGACRRELEIGSLVRVLPDWDMAGVELHAVFAAGRAAKPAARAFADFLVAEFATSAEGMAPPPSAAR